MYINGPTSLELGQTAAYAAIGSYGSREEDITARVTWRSLTPGVLEVQADGVVIARGLGEGMFSASLDSKTVNSWINVRPPGTFVFGGYVMNEAGAILLDASVTVIDERGEIWSTYTGWDAGYYFVGLKGRLRITVSSPGYVTQRKEVDLTSNLQLNFTLKEE